MSAFGEKHACRRFPAALLCVGLLSLAAPASAQSSADDLARRHFESGVAYLEESDYENALRAFEKSYELSRRPEILLNIAVVHERLGTLSDAIAALRQYLAEAPEGEHVETVRRRIENLEKRLPTQSAAEPSASASRETTPPVEPAATPPASSGAAPAPAQHRAIEKAPPAPNRSPAFIALGIGAAATAGAVLTGLVAQLEYDEKKESCVRPCPDSELALGKGMALANTVLAGVAVVAVGVGVTLYLSSEEEAPTASSVDLAVGALPAGAGLTGRVRF